MARDRTGVETRHAHLLLQVVALGDGSSSQAVFVSLFSVANCLGRLLAGWALFRRLPPVCVDPPCKDNDVVWHACLVAVSCSQRYSAIHAIQAVSNSTYGDPVHVIKVRSRQADEAARGAAHSVAVRVAGPDHCDGTRQLGSEPHGESLHEQACVALLCNSNGNLQSKTEL